MKNLWNDRRGKQMDALGKLVYRSRLIGSSPALCVWGGGNTSTKTVEKNFLGRPVKVLWVKGSGSDMKSCERRHFTPLELDKLLSLLARKEMSDEEMVDLLMQTSLRPKAPRPSIEALLHAFIPFNDIDHSHADAILAVTNNRKNHVLVKKLYGKELLWIPYVKPGFILSKHVYEAFQKNPSAKGAVLEKHGLITWGNDSRTSYGRMIQMVSRAEKLIQQCAKRKTIFGGIRFKCLSPRGKKEFLQRFLPVIRSAISGKRRMILTVVDSPAVMQFVNSKKAKAVSEIGPATPDHMLRTKRIPLFVTWNPNDTASAENSLTRQIKTYAKAHARYFNRFRSSGMTMQDPSPRVILIPGVGMVTTGKDLAAAKQCAEIYEHSIAVMRGAEAAGHYESLPLAKAFEMEYWPLELYKLSLAPPPKVLTGRIALVTGGGGSIGKAAARALSCEGAHVVITDLNESAAVSAADEINRLVKDKRAFGIRHDVTNEESTKTAIQQAVLRFGGLDMVVSNAGTAHISSVEEMRLSDWEMSLRVNATGHFLAAREAMRVFKRQGMGGNFIFIATKNVFAPGKDFGAYSASKSAEAQLAKILAIEGGEFNVRANIVNPDGIFEGSGLWSKEIRKSRAKSYGISENGLEKYYQNRNLLKTKILPEDVANAVLFLASDASAKTTGCTITVDGGVKEAFPR